MDTVSYWSATHTLPDFPAIDRDIEVDVVVVGTGLTGITTAYLLKQAGARVALLERDRIAAGDTSRTTRITYVADERSTGGRHLRSRRRQGVLGGRCCRDR